MKPWRLPGALRAETPLAVTSVARSHVGLVRQINEDRVFDRPEARVWAVADGMGGHGGGDLAAQAIVDALRAATDALLPIPAVAMLNALRAANRAIALRNADRREDAGATVVALHLDGTTATIAWVGDSRAYLLRDGVKQLTHDHSLVQELIDAGFVSAAAAQSHPHANVVTRALGVAHAVDIASTCLQVRSGDRILLCSDGLSRSLDASAISATPSLERFADTLLGLALQRDGSDNISLIAIDI